MDFDEWMQEVDRLMVRRYGVSTLDVEDWLWNDDWRNKLEPARAVEEWADEYFPE